MKKFKRAFSLNSKTANADAMGVGERRSKGAGEQFLPSHSSGTYKELEGNEPPTSSFALQNIDSTPGLPRPISQENLVTQLQEQVAAIVAKVGRLEKGLNVARGSRLSPKPSGGGLSVSGAVSVEPEPGLEQLQLQVKLLAQQQEQLQTLIAQAPTQQQLEELQNQVAELQQQARSNVSKGKGAEESKQANKASTSTHVVVDQACRMKADEDAKANMQATNTSKNREDVVSRGEMMRAFEALHSTLTTKIKRVIEEETRSKDQASPGWQEALQKLNAERDEANAQVSRMRAEGKREVEQLRLELETLRKETHQVNQRWKTPEIQPAPEGDALNSPPTGEQLRGTIVPNNAGATPDKLDAGARGAASPEMKACKEAIMGLQTDMGLLRQLLQGCNHTMITKFNLVEEQICELGDRTGALQANQEPGAVCPWQQKQMADSILQSIMSEIGPELEAYIRDAEEALQLAKSANGHCESFSAALNKSSKKVDELSSGLVLVTSKLNDRLTRIEAKDHERVSPSNHTSRRGSETGDSVRSNISSSRNLLEKWKSVSASKERPVSAPLAHQIAPSTSFGRSGSGALDLSGDKSTSRAGPPAKTASFRSRYKEREEPMLSTVLSGMPAEFPVYDLPGSMTPASSTFSRDPIDIRDSERSQYHTMMLKAQEEKDQEQRIADARQTRIERELASAKRRGSQSGHDTFSIVSEGSEQTLPSAFKINDADLDDDKSSLSRYFVHRISKSGPMSANSSQQFSSHGEPQQRPSYHSASGRVRFSDDGSNTGYINTNPPAEPTTDQEAVLHLNGGSVFGRRATKASSMPLAGRVFPISGSQPSKLAARSKQVMLKEAPSTSNFKEYTQAQMEKKNHLRKL